MSIKKLVSVVCIITMILTVIFSLPFGASAEINYSCGSHATWWLDTKTGELTVSGTGKMYDYENSTAPWSTYSSYIQSVEIVEGITYLGSNSFPSADSLTTVSFPSTMVKINGTDNFGETSVSDFLFPNGSGLVKITDYESIKYTMWYSDYEGNFVSLGGILFEYKTEDKESVTSVEIPDGIRLIDHDVFNGFTNLESVTFPNSLFGIGQYAFSGTAWDNNLPDGENYAGNVFYSYRGTPPLNTSISLKDGTLGIAAYAVCSELILGLTIPDSLIYLGRGALAGSTQITSLPLPSTFRYFDDYALTGTSFTDFEFPASTKYIGSYQFYNNYNLKNATYASGFWYEEIPECAFQFSLKDCTEFHIPDGTEAIGEYAFCDAGNGINIYFPKSIILINNTAFKGMSGTQRIGFFTFYCYKNSAAYYFALENKFPYVLLKEKDTADLTNLNAAISDAQSISRDMYTADSLAALDAAVARADTSDETATQTQVDAWCNAIVYALNTLEYVSADYYAVNETVKNANSIDRSLYTADSLAALDAAVGKVESGKTIVEQTQVNAWVRDINEALSGLVYLPADYANVETAISSYNAVDRDYYSALSLTILDQRVNAVEYDLDITKQTTVDGFAISINDAISALSPDSVVLKNDTYGTIVSGTTKELKKKSVLVVEPRENSDLEGSNFAVGGTVLSMNYYDVNIVFGGASVQPSGTVTVKMKIPTGADPLKCRVYHIDKDAVHPMTRYTNTVEGNYVVFETDHFSEYAVIEVEPTLNDIRITKSITKSLYQINEPLNLAGLEVTAELSDGTSRVVSDYEITMVDMSTPGEKTVNIYYTDNSTTKSASFTITVEGSKQAISVTTASVNAPSEMKYKSSEQLTLTLTDNADGYSTEWSSSDTSIATVDEGGTVTACGRGNVTITAKITNADGSVVTASKEIKCTMTVWERIVAFFEKLFGR